MRSFQDTFETRKPSFISPFSICTTVPLMKLVTNFDHRYLDTTYKVDYKDIYPCTSQSNASAEESDLSAAYKKCHSQFIDIADYRRHGRNTWQDESGQYANSEIKKEVYKQTNTIPERLQ